ncbi:MAG: PIN domain-containing protein [Litorimonas sp.]
MGESKTLKTNYVLIDHENIQPKNLSLLTDECFQIYVFVGFEQKCLNTDLVDAMHKIGPKRSQYIHITQTRKNALDFYITYYLGTLTQEHPKAYFHIISKDKGFDPLIEHLTTNGFHVNRRDTVADIPVLHISQNAEY